MSADDEAGAEPACAVAEEHHGAEDHEAGVAEGAGRCCGGGPGAEEVGVDGGQEGVVQGEGECAPEAGVEEGGA